MSPQIVVLTISMILTLLFFLYGFNLYYLLFSSRKYIEPVIPASDAGYRPGVCIHLPIYNEKYVIRRLVDACVKMARVYGSEKVQIVIIDDSTDDTIKIVDGIIKEYSEKHVRIKVLRRQSRQGYKAGALQAALDQTEEEFIAIFDADFIPAEDFLVRSLPHFFRDKQLGIIQSRWTHINRDYNFLTRAIAIGIDVHFFIEQAGRFTTGCFQNFNGSGGVMRKKALQASGGWQSDTLAEDLDVSYRIQMQGYSILFLKDLQSAGEIPPTVPSFKKQQGRWACGSLRTARKILPALLINSGLGFKKRLQAFIHLTGYIIHPLMLFSFLLVCLSTLWKIDTFKIDLQGIPLLIMMNNPESWSAFSNAIFQIITWGFFLSLIFLCTIAAWISPLAVLKRQGLPIKSNIPSLLILFLLGCGVSMSNTIEAGKALFTNRIFEFKRTPKYAIHHKQEEWQTKKYQVPLDLVWFLELVLTCLGGASIGYAIWRSNFAVLLILFPYTSAYLFVLILTLYQSRIEKATLMLTTKSMPLTEKPDWLSLWKDKNVLILSIFLQLVLGLCFGHYYDMRIFMATGYLVSSGQNPFIAQDLASVFNNPSFQQMTSIGYPPPWALILGLIFRATYPLTHSLLIYNLAIKVPIIAANICLAYLTVRILKKMGAEERTYKWAWRIILLSPFLLYFSTAWGQFDAIVAVLALSALALLESGKITVSALLLSAAISLKPIAFPLLPVSLIFLSGKSIRQALQFFAFCLTGFFLFCILPFIVFNWSPDPILSRWNAHFTVAGGMSLLTFYELLRNSYQLPNSWQVVGFAWVPALAIVILKIRKGINGFDDLIKKSTALILVFFLTRAWLSEPNILLVFPLVLILTLTNLLNVKTFNAFWILPLIFTIFNGSLPQLFFPSMPRVMEKLINVGENFRTIRLIAKIIFSIPWQIVGWRIVFICLQKNPPKVVNNWK